MGDILVGISINSDNIHDKTFVFLNTVLGYRNQLKMNHWQTKSYAEHKLIDDLIESIDENTDKIAEATLGAFGRPKFNTISNNISDIAIASTEYVLNCINKDIQEMLCIYKETEQEGIIALLGDFDGDIKKFIFLSTLS